MLKDDSGIKPFPTNFNYREFEGWLPDTAHPKSLRLDLRTLRSMSPFASHLFVSHLGTILSEGRPVEILTEDPELLSIELRRTLWDSGILRHLQARGAKLVGTTGSAGRVDSSFELVDPGLKEDSQGLVRMLGERCRRFLATHGPPATAWPVVDQLFSVVLFELVQNGLVHGIEDDVRYGIAVGHMKSDRRQSVLADLQGSIADIIVSDSGVGIENSAPAPPKGYRPPFDGSASTTDSEQRVLYALEFSVTRSPADRAKRIQDLLDSQEPLDPNGIATGLFAVASLVRRLRGTLHVRTPAASLRLDFADPDRPGQLETFRVGRASMSLLRGSHLLVRVPLQQQRTPTRRTALTSSSGLTVSYVAPFRQLDTEQPMGVGLQNALECVDHHLREHRSKPGVTMILPALQFFPPKVEAVFAAHLLAMAHQEQRVLWLTHTPEHLAETASLPSSGLPGQATLAGDLFANRFWQLGHRDRVLEAILEPSPSGGDVVQLAADIHGRLVPIYISQIASTLAEALGDDSVHETGLFLFSRKYYTTEFYNVAKFVADPRRIQLVAEWAAHTITPAYQLVVVNSDTLFPLAESLKARVSGRLPNPLDIIVLDQEDTAAKALRKLVPHLGKGVLVLTDVVCTEGEVRTLLNHMKNFTVVGVAVIVDARPATSPPWMASGNDGKSTPVPVWALRRSPVVAWTDDPPPQPAARDRVEIAFIDRGTKAPTVYSRLGGSWLNLKRLVEVATDEDILLETHLSTNGRHYSLYVDLERFQAAFNAEIEEWINKEVTIWSALKSADPAAQAIVLAYLDGDTSSCPEAAIRAALPTGVDVHSLHLTAERLNAPPPDRETGGADGPAGARWIIWIPATSTGHTWRKTLEYSSRCRPRSVLVLGMISRLPADERDFLLGVGRYRQASVHSSLFAEVPVSSLLNDSACPICSAVRQLPAPTDQLAGTHGPELQSALERFGEDSRPRQSLNEAKLRTVPGPDGKYLRLRAIGRVLLEAATTDAASRRLLKKWLADDRNRLAFVEMIGASCDRRLVTHSVFTDVLYSSEHSVRQTLIELLQGTSHSSLTADILRAAALIEPEVLAARSELLWTIKDRPDLHSGLAVALLLAGIRPILETESVGIATRLRDATAEVLRLTGDRRASAARAAITQANTVYQAIAKSGILSAELQTLTEYCDNDQGVDAIRGQATRLGQLWRDDTSVLLRQLEAGALWGRLRAHHPEMQLYIATLSDDIAVLCHYVIRSDVRTEGVLEVVRRIKAAKAAIASALWDFVTNPGIADILAGSILNTTHAGAIAVGIERDYRTPQIFFHRKDLNQALAEVLSNWTENATHGCQLAVQLLVRGQTVVFRCGDTIPDDVRLNSSGGFAFMTSTCSEYGGEVVHMREGEWKWIEFWIPTCKSLNQRWYEGRSDATALH